MVKQSNRLSNKKQRLKVNEKGETRQDQRRPVLGRKERIDIYPKWSQQQGVREEKGEQRHKDRGYKESQEEGKMQERREESKAEGEGDKYLSKGEDGRPYNKWIKK